MTKHSTPTSNTPKRGRGKSRAESEEIMNENTKTRAPAPDEKNIGRDVTPEQLKRAVAPRDFSEKLLFNAMLQMGLAFEAARNAGKQA